MNLPMDSLSVFEAILSSDEENKKPIVDRLKEMDEKFAEELLRYVKL